jgi:tetratricopeptide (TPR) repeat protein
MAHHFYGGYLLAVGRPADALAENDRARQLDPFSIPINTMRTMIFTGLRQYDQALDQAERAGEISPKSMVPPILLARIYWLLGRAPEAIAESRKAATLGQFPEWLHDQDEVAAVYAKSGLHAARLKAAQMMEKHYKGNDKAIMTAFQYGTVEDGPKVLHWLEESLRTEEGNLPLQTKTAPEFDFLSADPQFQALLRRIGLPQ